MHWLSIHFYPLENQDVFLVRALRPFFQQHIWSQKGARGFFIRYQDEQGPHLRIRMGGEESWVEETLRPAFAEWQEGRGEWKEIPYTAETERFGGAEAMTWAEEHFHLSTRVSLDRLASEQHTYGDSMFDSLRMLSIMAHAAKLTQEDAARYFSRLYAQWAPLFLFPGTQPDSTDLETLETQFQSSFAAQESDLRGVLSGLWKALETEKFDKKQPEWARWALGNQMILPSLGESLERALPSLMHLSNNRMGILNPDEVYLCYILSKALQ